MAKLRNLSSGSNDDSGSKKILSEKRFLKFQGSLFGVFKTLEKLAIDKDRIRKRLAILAARKKDPPEGIEAAQVESEDQGWNFLKKIFGGIKDALATIWGIIKGMFGLLWDLVWGFTKLLAGLLGLRILAKWFARKFTPKPKPKPKPKPRPKPKPKPKPKVRPKVRPKIKPGFKFKPTWGESPGRRQARLGRRKPPKLKLPKLTPKMIKNSEVYKKLKNNTVHRKWKGFAQTSRNLAKHRLGKLNRLTIANDKLKTKLKNVGKKADAEFKKWKQGEIEKNRKNLKSTLDDLDKKHAKRIKGIRGAHAKVLASWNNYDKLLWDHYDKNIAAKNKIISKAHKDLKTLKGEKKVLSDKFEKFKQSGVSDATKAKNIQRDLRQKGMKILSIQEDIANTEQAKNHLKAQHADALDAQDKKYKGIIEKEIKETTKAKTNLDNFKKTAISQADHAELLSKAREADRITFEREAAAKRATLLEKHTAKVKEANEKWRTAEKKASTWEQAYNQKLDPKNPNMHPDESKIKQIAKEPPPKLKPVKVPIDMRGTGLDTGGWAEAERAQKERLKTASLKKGLTTTQTIKPYKPQLPDVKWGGTAPGWKPGQILGGIPATSPRLTADTSQKQKANVIKVDDPNKKIGKGKAPPITWKTINKGAIGGSGAAAKFIDPLIKKTVLRLLPAGVGAALGVFFGTLDFIAGDVTGAAMQFTSGGLAFVPGAGTAAALAIEALYLQRAVYSFLYNEEWLYLPPHSDTGKKPYVTVSVTMGGKTWNAEPLIFDIHGQELWKQHQGPEYSFTHKNGTTYNGHWGPPPKVFADRQLIVLNYIWEEIHRFIAAKELSLEETKKIRNEVLGFTTGDPEVMKILNKEGMSGVLWNKHLRRRMIGKAGSMASGNYEFSAGNEGDKARALAKEFINTKRMMRMGYLEYKKLAKDANIKKPMNPRAFFQARQAGESPLIDLMIQKRLRMEVNPTSEEGIKRERELKILKERQKTDVAMMANTKYLLLPIHTTLAIHAGAGRGAH